MLDQFASPLAAAAAVFAVHFMSRGRFRELNLRLAHLDARMARQDARMERQEAATQDLRTELKGDIQNLRAEVRADFKEVRSEIAALRSDVTQIAFALSVPPRETG
jgi:septal ring factor EnvC (AmiA/AmiB activator)